MIADFAQNDRLSGRTAKSCHQDRKTTSCLLMMICGSMGKTSHQLVNCAGPALFVADPGSLGLELRMSEGEFGADINWLEIEHKTGEITRFIRFTARSPFPAHDQVCGLLDLQIFAGTLMFTSIQHAKPHPVGAADAHIGLGKQNRTCVRSPPSGDPFWRGECFKHNRGSRLDL